MTKQLVINWITRLGARPVVFRRKVSQEIPKSNDHPFTVDISLRLYYYLNKNAVGGLVTTLVMLKSRNNESYGEDIVMNPTKFENYA